MATGKPDPLLLGQIPPAAQALWEAFCSLTTHRRVGFGLSPLTFVDIEAWCRLNGVDLTPWELDTLLQLDAKTLQLAAEHQRSAQGSKP